MKIRNILFGACCLTLFAGCKDMMDYNESTNYTQEDVFSSFSRTGDFVTNIYSHMDYDFGQTENGGMLSSACDESEYAWSWSGIHDYFNGSWSAINPKSNWKEMYEGIRDVNYFLDVSKGQTFEPFKENKDYLEQMVRFNNYQYEVRFLRAYFYFNLVRQYGDVPLITQVLTTDQANSVSRTPNSEVFNYIIKECDAIADSLPNVYDSGYKETGRASRIAVLALKARTLLYEASPLFNKTNDISLWHKAALASKAVIDVCLANGKGLGAYTNLWGTDSWENPEIIFARRIGDINYLEIMNFPTGVESASGGNCPTQNLVDAFEMQSTGKLWNEAGSGYDPQNPYINRDPRMNMIIAKNGDKAWPTYNTHPIQTYIGGANGLPLSGATPTGYYLRKFLDASVDLRPTTINYKRHSWITYRLGEFYLNYAEATFKYLGSPDATSGDLPLSASDAVNAIRNRTGVSMPNLPVGLSNNEFEAKYINERRVELAFEDHRFWDVRRWKIGDTQKSITLMQITKNTDDSYSYSRITKQRIWDDKMYLFPIPDSERRINPNLTQNSGW